tara:strand:- start:438 stop:602 length:165 start_codon:yes stop_codon:yes gene_type:complete
VSTTVMRNNEAIIESESVKRLPRVTKPLANLAIILENENDGKKYIDIRIIKEML